MQCVNEAQDSWLVFFFLFTGTLYYTLKLIKYITRGSLESTNSEDMVPQEGIMNMMTSFMGILNTKD